MADALVLQSDFGVADGAVSAMYGVALSVSPTLRICDLTHEIPQYDIWEASYRLIQTVSYWPEGTVFVSVVDPGVGSARRSIVAKTANGRYVVTPDNGTLTHVKRMIGLSEVRVIDVAGVGPEVAPESVIELPIVDAMFDGESVHGTIDVLDVRFGSLWTNIPRELFAKLGVGYGQRVEVTIENGTRMLYKNFLTFARSFADVYVGEPLVYSNSLDCMAVAINQGSFAKAYGIGTGVNWKISLRKAPRLVYE